MVNIAEGWLLDVDRGPDWLFVRLHCPPDRPNDAPQLAEGLWALLEQHLTNRLVLEMDDVSVLHSYLIGQMILLYKRIHGCGGMLRICGLSPPNREVLRLCRMEQSFPLYESRAEAMRCFRAAPVVN
jgi:anti-anti-sigma factor